MEIIPAIDIIDGKCVRLSQGDFSTQKVYFDDPLYAARTIEDSGLSRLHLVDLDAAKTGKMRNYKILYKIASETNLVVDYGGGIKTDTDVSLAFDSGASMITAGSVAVKNMEKVLEWVQLYGAERIILGADVRENKVMVSGWQQESEEDIFGFLNYYLDNGLRKVICTDIACDGMLSGSSMGLYKQIIERYPEIQLIASGGVSSVEELKELKKQKLYGAIIGKAIYEGRIKLKEVSRL